MGMKMNNIIWALGYTVNIVGYALTEVLLAIVEDPKMPEQKRITRPHD